MEFKSIKKKEEGRFITRYDIEYETRSGQRKNYEIISRDKELDSFDKLHNKKADAVVIIMHSEDGSRVLLNREFRLAVGDWVYNFPAGMIDEGEDAQTAARRELHEETGLDLIRIDDTISDSYSAVGFSNETNVCVVGVAGGSFAPSDSDVEEIEAGWFTKAEVRNLLKTQKFAARSQAYCYLWSKE